MGWLDKIFKKRKVVVIEPPIGNQEDKGFVTVETDTLTVIDSNVSYASTDLVAGVDKYVWDEDAQVLVYPLLDILPEKDEVVSNDIKPLDLAKTTFKPSPNQSKRDDGEEVLYIVLHHTGPGSFNGIVNWLCNKDAKASAHYVLGVTAQLTQLVNTGKQAWHAGRASWGVLKNNSHSVGIEICNIGIMEKGDDGAFYYEQGRVLKKYTGKVPPEACSVVYPSGKVLQGYAVPYPEKQLNKLVALCKALVEKYPKITRENIVTHFQIASPEGRKNDPAGLDIEKIKDMIFE